MNKNPIENSIYSQVDVIETLKIVDQWGLKPEVASVVYAFASELMGVSTDQILEWLNDPESKIDEIADAMATIDDALVGLDDDTEEYIRYVMGESGYTEKEIDVYIDTYCGSAATIECLAALYKQICDDKKGSIIISERIDDIFGASGDTSKLVELEGGLNYNPDVVDAVRTLLNNAELLHLEESTEASLFAFNEKISKRSLDVIGIGSNVGHEYWKYIRERDYFTVTTNDFFTVGHVVTDEDDLVKAVEPNAEYVCHLDFNYKGQPEVCFGVIFTDGGDYVNIDIYLGRRGYVSETRSCVSVVGYCKKLAKISAPKIWAYGKIAVLLAKEIEDLIPEVMDTVCRNPSLKTLLPYQAKVERV